MESSITLDPELAARLERIGRHADVLQAPDLDGNLAGAFDSGMLTAIARRASVLARELAG